MSKKIILLVGSPRRQGNTMTVSQWVAEGATAAGADVRLVDVTKLNGIGHGCLSCYRCQKSTEYRCSQKDEVTELLLSLSGYDTICFATPVYFFSFSSQLRSVIDRMLSLIKYNGAGEMQTPLRCSQLALVATAGDTEEQSGVDSMRLSLSHFVDYFHLPAVESLFFGSCDKPADMRANVEARGQSIAFGKKLAMD
ncbi:MAG: flavodoxin family protein [Thermoguttaceae bacterium]|nr:flavodoxin family protein [Thermoguttaceae bacterium]